MHWIIWRWGPRGPQIAMLTNKELDEHDRRAKLCDPIQLAPGDERLSLDHLAKLYPAPENGEYK